MHGEELGNMEEESRLTCCASVAAGAAPQPSAVHSGSRETEKS